MTTALEARQAAFNQKLQELAQQVADGDNRKKFLAEMDNFRSLVNSYLDKSRYKPLVWEKIKPPPEGMIRPLSALPECPKDQIKTMLKKLAVVKLNGGLGTTMGCTGPKSVIEVRNEQTFLDLTVAQIEYLNRQHQSNVPLVLMNSFNTHADTLKIIHKYKSNLPIHTFNQSCYPRLFKESMLPMPDKVVGQNEAWYPPGHGDIFPAIFNSGVLDTLIAEGREYIFVSNVDNLGATVDLNLLYHMVTSNSEFIMEVTDKTAADIKGGTLIEYEGRAKLLEIAQVPSSKVDEFKSVKKFKIFNTNNMWISLAAVKRLVQADAFRDMDIIVNPKTEGGKQIVQLERAAGAAIEYFQRAQGVNVPRARFIPVKSTGDLLVVQSNLYTVKDGILQLHVKRPFGTVPFVKLGDEFKKVADYQKRFRGLPDILELDHLTVAGDVTFGEAVKLQGTVVVVANPGQKIDIPPFSILTNKVVSGNLRILDH